MKENKGITLVSLVITIIVLLILAGITINLTIGERGIIAKAQQAGKNYLNAQAREEAQLGEFENELNNIIEHTQISGGETPGGKQIISLGEKQINYNNSVTFDLTSIKDYQTLTVDNIKLCITNFDMYTYVKDGSQATYCNYGSKGAGKNTYNPETGILTVSNLGWSMSTSNNAGHSSYYTKITVECLVVIE